MRSPNEEQKMAIEHSGGVLLKAGAGSGKTFVLVEHIIHRLKEIIHDQDVNTKVSTYFSSTVLMTFTNLAAGEIKVRLYSRLEEQIKSDHDKKDFWQLCYQHLPKLMITTIDGFFFKLIKRGYFSHLSPSLEVVQDDIVFKRLSDLMNRWLGEKHHALYDVPEWHSFLSEESNIKGMLLNIFTRPERREVWEQFTPEKSDLLDQYFLDIQETYHWNRFLSHHRPSLAQFPKLESFFDQLETELNVKKLSKWDDLIVLHNKFLNPNFKFPKAPIKTKEGAEGAIDYLNSWKEFVKSINLFGELYKEFKENYSTKIHPFMGWLIELVSYVSEKYPYQDGLSYSDIEYYVKKGLQDEETLKKISNDFNFFIIDEFQDTSFLQFNIIFSIAESNYHRLFCIGDAKQAIYGFRGGEVSLFKDCEKYFPQTLELVKNYRSMFEVIDFNNKLFNYVLPLSSNWEGTDEFTVSMADQAFPGDFSTELHKKIHCLKIFKSNAKKISNDEMNELEANAIVDFFQNNPLANGKQTTVLYKYLRASLKLINILLNSNISFEAQLKIPFAQDLYTFFLYHLCQRLLNSSSNRDDFFKLMIDARIQLANFNRINNLENKLEKFEKNCRLFGIQVAFDTFVAEAQVGTQRDFSSLHTIHELFRLYSGDISKIYAHLEKIKNDDFSIKFNFQGDEAKGHQPILIMTAHASKGLEFDRVILAGLNTNEYNGASWEQMGSFPGSILWKKNNSDKKRIRSPLLQWEIDLLKKKNFSESKRLFYVAATRAKSEIVFSMLLDENNESLANKNSWGQALEKFLGIYSGKLPQLNYHEVSTPEFDFENDSTPFFHGKKLNYFSKIAQSELLTWGLTSELSVTRLAILNVCPFKFYLKNIIKLESDSKKASQFLGEPENEPPLSSADRGTKIHAILSHALQHNFVLPIDDFEKKDQDILKNTLNKISEKLTPSSQIISEQILKFSLFELMVTGIPDLILLKTRNHEAEIWDFKTGRPSLEKSEQYWIQLLCYAYALYGKNLVEITNPINLVLYYVDSAESFERTVSFLEVKETLFNLWSKLANLDQVNQSHCSTCEFNTLCPHA